MQYFDPFMQYRTPLQNCRIVITICSMKSEGSQIKITMTIVLITSFITPFMSNAVSLAIPGIGVEFGATQGMLNWIVSSFLISTAASLLPFGSLADRYGRKKVFFFGMILLAASSLGCALAPSIFVLIGFRVVQGLASAMMLGTSIAILTSVIPPETRGRALGINAAVTYIGLTCGPVIGGFISNALNWRALFYLNALMAVAVLVLTAWKLRGEWRGDVAKMDAWGIVLCIFAQGFLLFGLTDLTAGLLYQICFVLGIILLLVFFFYERKSPNPLIPVESIMKNRTFVFSNIATLFNYCATFAITFILSLYLQVVMGMNPSVSGLILLIQPIIMAALSPVTGTLSDRVAPAFLAAIGIGLSAVGLFLFSLLTVDTPVVFIILNQAFIGVGYAMFSSPNTNAVMSSVDGALYGVASSIIGNMRVLGQSISIAVVSLITSVLIQNLALGSPEYTDKFMISLKISFIVFAVMCAFGVWASLAGKRRRL